MMPLKNDQMLADAQHRLRNLRQERRLTLDALAKKAGTTKAQIDKLEKGDRRLTLDWLERLAGALDTDASYFLQPNDDAAALEDSQETTYMPSVSSLSLPIYGRVDSLAGILCNLRQINSYAARPPQLHGVPGGFAVYMVGDAMQPRYHAGDVLYVHPNKPVTTGCYVLVVRHDDTAIVGQFAGRQPDDIVLRVFNPEATIAIPITSLRQLARVVASAEEG
jgi:transcriptional regulator with XRE-family HTH domain